MALYGKVQLPFLSMFSSEDLDLADVMMELKQPNLAGTFQTHLQTHYKFDRIVVHIRSVGLDGEQSVFSCPLTVPLKSGRV